MSPAAWETVEARKRAVLFAYISPPEGKVSMQWAQHLRRLQLPLGSVMFGATGLPFGPARNQCVEQMLVGGYNWLFMLDTDTLAPDYTVMKLLATGKEIVGGLYYRRTPPFTPVPSVRIVNAEGKIGLKEIDVNPPGAMIPCDFLPTGCTLYSRRAIETVMKFYPKPFEWTMDIDNKWQGVSEDFMFSWRAKELGIQPYVDTSIVCQHELQMVVKGGGQIDMPDRAMAR